MRVLEVFGEPVASGGQESFIFNVLKNIDRTDLVLDFFTPYFCSNEEYLQLIEVCGGKLICAGLPFLPGKSRRNIIQPLRECLSRSRYDAVHIHSGSTTVLAYGAYAAHLCRVPNIIVHSHCTNIDNLKYRLTKRYAAYFFRRYPTAFCACSYEAGEAKFPPHILREQLQVINNGIDLDRFAFRQDVRAEYRRKLEIGESAILVGHVGRFSEQKNHRFDLEILRELKHLSPGTEFQLLWIGEGELDAELRRLTKETGLEDSIIFQGVVSNVNDYLQAMDVFILPSLFEGLGIVGVEAQAAGLPVFASNSVPKALGLTESVRFLPLDSAELWARQILDNCHERKPENTQALASKGYSIRDTAAAVRALYFKPGEHYI